MEPLTPIQKLDAVLSVFNPKHIDRGLPDGEVKWALQVDKKIAIDDRLLNEILHKLVKDEYLRIEHRKTGSPEQKEIEDYHLTFDGELFMQNGGFTAKFESLNAEKLKIDLENERRKIDNLQSLQNSRILNWLTAALVMIGLVVILWDAWKYGNDHCWFCCHCH